MHLQPCADPRGGARLRALLLPLLLACAAGGAQAATCRVASGASGTGDGATWASAMTLPNALAASGCDEIWLKQGLYKPGTQRSDSFNITRPLKLYGGFTGGETALAQRGTNSHLTVLSGDIDGDDTVDANRITAHYGDIQGSNSYHVVRIIPSSTNPAFTPTNTVIDGLTITGGQATGSNPDHMGAGLLCQALSAGRKCSPRIANVTFSGNRADNSGGGMLTSAKTTGESSPVVTHSTFSGNRALYGGGLAVDVIPNSDATTGSPAIAHSTFNGNAADRGGAVYLAQTVAASVEHVTFANNTASAYGGALHAQHGAQASVAASVFWGNTASNGNQISLANTTDGNGSTGTRADVGSLTGNIVEGGCTGVHSVQNAMGCTGTPSTGDPLLDDLADNGGPTWTMLPAAGSPALNTAACVTAGKTDQRGAERPVGACDIGAVERRLAMPALPAGLTATNNLVQQIALAWNAASGAVTYRVKDVTNAPTIVCQTSATACVVTVAGHGVARSYTVEAANDVGSSVASAPQQGATLALPGQPASFAASSGGVRASTLTWNAPGTGGAVDRYIVTSGGAEVCNTTALNCSVTGLANGTAYTFTLLARNAAGDSGTASANATTLALPATPANFSAAPGVRQIVLTWNAAADAASYTVTDVTGTPAVVCNTGATTCTPTGLGDGDTRSYALVARNGAGDSAATPAGATTFAPPSVPRSVAATPGDRSVQLAWAVPASDGGSPITGYSVAVSPSGTCTPSPATATSCTATGLGNGTEYTFTVRASNAAGHADAPSVQSTPRAAPGAPQNVTATPGDRRVQLAWAAPTDDGGSPITGYSVAMSPSGTCAPSPATATTCTATGLGNGTEYSFTVRASNAAGHADASPVQSTPRTAPGAPQNVTATPGDRSVQLAWAAPADDGGSPITGYSVAVSPSGTCTPSPATATTCTATGLGNGTEYSFTVRASNAAGHADASPVQATPIAVPGAPQNVAATPGDGSVRITWDTPASDGGSAITGYTVTVDGSPAACTASPCAVAGLANGTAYRFTVSAVNALGATPAAAVLATPATLGAANVALPGNAGSAQVEIGGNPPGCALSAPVTITRDAPAGAPAGATEPLGVLRFAASGCTDATLTVRVTYPAGRLAGLKPYKFGPPQAGADAAWFPHGAITGDTVEFTVQDNGTGDNNAAPGVIEDPFTLLALPVAGATAIPTLSQWGLLLLSALSALLGAAALRRTAGFKPKRA